MVKVGWAQKRILVTQFYLNVICIVFDLIFNSLIICNALFMYVRFVDIVLTLYMSAVTPTYRQPSI
jgi:hypothetical protein